MTIDEMIERIAFLAPDWEFLLRNGTIMEDEPAPSFCHLMSPGFTKHSFRSPHIEGWGQTVQEATTNALTLLEEFVRLSK
jgi:hypothetical protein